MIHEKTWSQNSRYKVPLRLSVDARDQMGKGDRLQEQENILCTLYNKVFKLPKEDEDWGKVLVYKKSYM